MTFELVLNAGPDRAAAEQVAAQLTDLPPLPAGRYRVSLLPPRIRVERGEDGVDYQEVSVSAAGVGHERVTADRAIPPGGGEVLPLETDELTELGHGLYEVLRGCRGYRVAAVGWNPEFLVDIASLNQDWAEDLAAGRPDGVVLSDEAMAELTWPAAVEAFAPGYSWLPWRGHGVHT